MRYVSLNVWGGRCWTELKSWIPQIDADMLCLQEVIRAPVPAPEWLTYKDPNRTLVQRPNLFDEISALLPDHYGIFAPAARGPLEDETGKTYQTEHGIALWVHKRHSIVALHNDYAFGRFRAQGWGREPVPRAIQLARVWVDAFQKEIVLGHFHGLRHPDGKGEIPERGEQTEQVANHIGVFRQALEPCIVGGDFNILPDNSFFKTMSAMGLRDQVVPRGFADTRTQLYPKPQRYANYLLTSSEVWVQKLDLPALPEVSDHRPMILDFAL